ncbi:MAG: hypothetical protein GXY26_03130 [Clostridiales bacterium]|mgnify:CR=1 FL=1|nr:hypothetical protein [Clostridiales bacterium]
MADILELSVQYRNSGIACKYKLVELRRRADSEDLTFEEKVEVKRQITMLTAMSRDCIAISNYLRTYSERRDRLEQLRKSARV